MTPTLDQHALAYGAKGLEVFPCRPNKAPYTVNGMKDATTDIITIERWWHRWPDALIGCRIPPELVLLDVDPKHGGDATWRLLKQLHEPAPTRAHRSGRNDGGGHLWYQRPTGKLSIKPLNDWAKANGVGEAVGNHSWVSGIDLLHHNHRYTILPPSPHPDTGQPYSWVDGRDLSFAPLDMPPWLAELITEPEKTAEPPRAPSERQPGSIADWYTDTARWRDILEPDGWTLVGGDGDSDGSKWLHPTASSESSATIRYGQLFVYSPNTDFDMTTDGEPHGYTRFKAWALLRYGGDQSAAARAAKEMRDGPAVPLESLIGIVGTELPETPEFPNVGNSANQATRTVSLTPASAIKVRPVHWLWDKRVALGTLSLIGGREGIGKSTVAYTLAADITKGTLPGRYFGTPKAVIVAATEDSWEHTIVPRLMAARADLDRVFRVDVETPEGMLTSVSLPRDLIALERHVGEVDAAMILLDPLMSRLDAKLDTHKDAEVRLALEPLTAIADRTSAAVFGLIHVNKSISTDPLTTLMGSRAFAAVARSVLFVIVDPDNEGVRVLGQPKNNLGRIDLPSLTFTIAGAHVADTEEGPVWTGKVVWTGETERSIAEVLRSSGDSEDTRNLTAEASDWLSDFIDLRRVAPCQEVITEGKKEGHALGALNRARKNLGIGSLGLGMPRRTYWSKLPPDEVKRWVESHGE